MMTEIYMSLEDVYTAALKALVRVPCDDLGQYYMRGIFALVAQIESDLLDAQHGVAETEEEKDE